jgi:RNase P subunit RPR2
MSKTSRKMFHNLYENDVLDLDAIEELEEVAPLKSNKSIKKAAKKSASSKQASTPAKSTVSTKPVEALCNKCNNKIVGDLVSDLYMPHLDKMVPLISYTCTNCGHVGRRSVFALALPLDQYERKFFN